MTKCWEAASSRILYRYGHLSWRQAALCVFKPLNHLSYTSQYIFYSKDPRRVKPLIDYILENFKSCAFDGELSFNATKWASFTRAFYEEMGWRSVAWIDEILDRYWLELNNEHDEVRAYIADALEFSGKATVST